MRVGALESIETIFILLQFMIIVFCDRYLYMVKNKDLYLLRLNHYLLSLY